MGDDSVEIEGYEGPVDDSPSYSPSPGRRNIPSPGRKGGKRNLSPAPRTGHRSRSMSRSWVPSLGINPRELAGAISSMFLIAVIGVVAVVAILYYTFSSGSYPASLPQFYGALAAAMVFVLMLAYIGVRLLGGGE